MTDKDILIDMTSKPRTRHTLHRCFYCKGHEKFGRVIMPYDKDAKVTSRGDHKCGVCITEDVKKSLSLFGGGNK